MHALRGTNAALQLQRCSPGQQLPSLPFTTLAGQLPQRGSPWRVAARRLSSGGEGTTSIVVQRSNQASDAQQQLPKTQPLVANVPGLSAAHRAWESVEAKQKIVIALAGAFCLSNIDKTVFTVAIIPMGLEYGWSATTAGMVQAAFFYGFLLMQLPGGMMSTMLGGQFVLPRGLAVWSAATAALPIVASNMTALCATRAVMGAGEAVAPSAIIDMISKSVPKEERASAVSTAFAGLHVGSIIALLASPVIIESAGWPALFYTFGAAGAVWMVWFQSIVDSIKVSDPELAARLLPPTPAASTTTTLASASSSHAAAPPKASVAQQWLRRLGRQAAGLSSSSNNNAASEAAAPATAAPAAAPAAAWPAIPYRAFLRSAPVRALMFTHFCHNWFHYTMLSWLPTYFTSTLDVDLMHAAQTALFPPVAGILASAIAGSAGDALVAKGVPVPTVRKIAQTAAFMGPAAFLWMASQVPCTPQDSQLAVAAITIALGMSSFSLAGLYCTHGDMSPKYASALLGMTNVAGSLPGIIGVATVGALYDQTQDWNLALFAPSAVLMVMGTAAYTMGARFEPLDFDAHDNSEFWVEKSIKSWLATTPLAKAVQSLRSSVANARHPFLSRLSADDSDSQQ